MAEPEPRGPEAQVVAFYLPQFHQISENDAWWGEGFTEWTNVRRATPWYEGHRQPREPGELGYYDLRNVDVHRHQAALAKAHGISAFCYYAYWFGGRRILHEPLDLVLANPDIGMPYAICWANEPWSRRWDGSEDQVLLAQAHDPERDAGFIDSIAPHLADERYLRVDGRPTVLLYRVGLLRDPLRTTDIFRERARSLGLGDLHLVSVQSWGHWEPISYGFDAAVEFGPIGMPAREAAVRGNAGFRGRLFDYVDAAAAMLGRPAPLFPWYRTVAPDWDNTPRRGANGTAFVGANDVAFEAWLQEALRYTYLFHPPQDRLLFVNAWNEWGEGAYLEPDADRGTAMLQAVQRALVATAGYANDTAALFETSALGSLLEEARSHWKVSAQRRFVLQAAG